MGKKAHGLSGSVLVVSQHLMKICHGVASFQIFTFFDRKIMWFIAVNLTLLDVCSCM